MTTKQQERLAGLIKAYKCDLHNLNEARKLPESKRQKAYIKRAAENIDSTVRAVGKIISPKPASKKHWREVGEEYLHEELD